MRWRRSVTRRPPAQLSSLFLISITSLIYRAGDGDRTRDVELGGGRGGVERPFLTTKSGSCRIGFSVGFGTRIWADGMLGILALIEIVEMAACTKRGWFFLRIIGRVECACASLVELNPNTLG